MATRAGLRLTDLVNAGWIDAPDVGIPLSDLRTVARADGFRASLRYDGTDIHALLSLIAAGGGLALLPRPALDGRPDVIGIPLSEPRVVHRTELIHGSLVGPAAALATMLASALRPAGQHG